MHRPMRTGLGRFSRTLTILGVAALFVMMMATVADVVMRSFAGRPLRGVVELVEVTMLLVVFLGLPEAFLRREQVVVDLIDSFVSPWILKLTTTLSLLFTILVLWIIGYNVIQPMLDAYRFSDVKFELNIPVYPLYAVVLICFAASLVTTAYSLLEIWRGNDGQVTQ